MTTPSKKANELLQYLNQNPDKPKQVVREVMNYALKQLTDYEKPLLDLNSEHNIKIYASVIEKRDIAEDIQNTATLVKTCLHILEKESISGSDVALAIVMLKDVKGFHTDKQSLRGKGNQGKSKLDKVPLYLALKEQIKNDPFISNEDALDSIKQNFEFEVKIIDYKYHDRTERQKPITWKKTDYKNDEIQTTPINTFIGWGTKIRNEK